MQPIRKKFYSQPALTLKNVKLSCQFGGKTMGIQFISLFLKIYELLFLLLQQDIWKKWFNGEEIAREEIRVFARNLSFFLRFRNASCL